MQGKPIFGESIPKSTRKLVFFLFGDKNNDVVLLAWLPARCTRLEQACMANLTNPLATPQIFATRISSRGVAFPN